MEGMLALLKQNIQAEEKKQQREKDTEKALPVPDAPITTTTKKGQKVLHCPYCKVTMLHMDSYRNHVASHQGKGPVTCPKCSKTFANKPALKPHLISHQIREGHGSEFQCPTCHHCFQSQKVLASHRQYAHTPAQVCDLVDPSNPNKICGASIKGGPHRFRAHQRECKFNPDRDTPKCRLCGKTFASKRNLQTHLKKQHSVGNFGTPQQKRGARDSSPDGGSGASKKAKK